MDSLKKFSKWDFTNFRLYFENADYFYVCDPATLELKKVSVPKIDKNESFRLLAFDE